MRTFIKIVGWGFLGLVVLAGCAYAIIYRRGNEKLRQRYTLEVAAAPLPTDAEARERGRHIATIRGCLECHGADGGGAKIADGAAMGKIYGPNLTQGRGGLNATYRNEDWVRAIRHGVGADGRALFIMPSGDFSGLTEDDMGALISFLVSLPKVDRDTVPLSFGPVGRIILATKKMSAEAIDHSKVEPTRVETGITANYGRYVAVSCMGCHGENLSGGKIETGPPDWPPASNLTSGPGSAIAQWSEADFIKTLRTAHRPNGTELNQVMPRAFGQMTDIEMKALWSYLKTLPPAATGKREPSPSK